MQSDKTITTLDGKTLQIRFGQNALYLLEEHLAKLHQQGVLRSRKFSYTDEKTGNTVELDLAIGVEDLAQLPRRLGCQVGLWAGLEGARKKYKTRTQPYTIEEAGDIIDDCGGFQAIESTVIEAFKAAFPQLFPEDQKQEGTEGAEKNAPPEPAKTGTRRSSKPAKSESLPMNSGTVPNASTTSA